MYVRFNLNNLSSWRSWGYGFLSLAITFSLPVVADDRYEDIWSVGSLTGTYPSGPAACTAVTSGYQCAMQGDVQPTATPNPQPAGDNQYLCYVNCEWTHSGTGQFQSIGEYIDLALRGTALVEHTHNDDFYTQPDDVTDDDCQGGTGFLTNHSLGAVGQCAGGCGFVVNGELGNGAVVTYTGSACGLPGEQIHPDHVVEEFSNHLGTAGTENTYTDVTGAETTYPNPDLPPDEVVPSDSLEVTDLFGETQKVELYSNVDGEEIYVFTDSNGVVYTDVKPIDGNITYSNTYIDTTGGGTSGTSDSGVSDSGTTTSGSSDSGSGDSGTTEENPTEEPATVSGGGSCDSQPACTGDTIACAIRLQQWYARCDLQTAIEENEAIVGTGLQDFTPDMLVKDEIELPTSFDDSGWLSNRECPADISLTLMGVNYQISMAPMCQIAQIAGIIISVFGYYHGVRIIADL